MKTDICSCGQSKDHRAIRCRKCVDLEKAAQPCKGCGRSNVVFGRRGNRRRGRCKECEAKWAREWRKANPEEVKRRKKAYAKKYPDRVHRGKMRRGWRKIGLDPDDIEKRLSNHNGLCEICGQPPKIYKELSADHSHTTKKFRGFLCYKCNLGIGQFNDDPELLLKAVDYIRKHNRSVSDKSGLVPLSNSPAP